MTKSELRALIARQVAALPPDYCREADGAICRHVLDWEVYRQAKAVFCYVGTDREIDTRPILRDALDRGKVLAVPLCVAKGVMEARQIRSLENLVPGKYGILEPGPDCPLVAPEALDLARETARDVQTWLPGVRVVAAALRETDCVKEVFVC